MDEDVARKQSVARDSQGAARALTPDEWLARAAEYRDEPSDTLVHFWESGPSGKLPDTFHYEVYQPDGAIEHVERSASPKQVIHKTPGYRLSIFGIFWHWLWSDNPDYNRPPWAYLQTPLHLKNNPDCCSNTCSFRWEPTPGSFR